MFCNRPPNCSVIAPVFCNRPLNCSVIAPVFCNRPPNCSVVAPVFCNRPPNCSVIVPLRALSSPPPPPPPKLLCHRPCVLSSSPCSVIVPVFCHRPPPHPQPLPNRSVVFSLLCQFRPIALSSPPQLQQRTTTSSLTLFSYLLISWRQKSSLSSPFPRFFLGCMRNCDSAFYLSFSDFPCLELV